MANLCDTAMQPYIVTTVSATNATGNGTVYTPPWDIIAYQNNFTISGGGVMTFHIGGIYLFCIRAEASNLNSSATSAIYNLVTTLRTIKFTALNIGAWRSQASLAQLSGYAIAQFLPGDTASITLQISGTSQTIGINSVSTLTVMRIF